MIQVRPDPSTSGPGTSMWLFIDPEFIKWKDDPNSFLWLHGKGKISTRMRILYCLD